MLRSVGSVKNISFANGSRQVRLLCLEDDPITSAANGNTSSFEDMSLKLWSAICKSFPFSGSIWDIGSFIGIYSLIGAQATTSKKIFAFEPSSGSFQRLLSHIRINEAWGQIFPLQIALSDSKKRVLLHHEYGWYVLSSGESIASPSSESYYTEEIPAFSGDGLFYKGEVLEVQHSRGIPLFEAPGLIKIDIEGHELECLKGLRKLISDFRPIFLIEVLTESRLNSLMDVLSDYCLLQVNDVAGKINSHVDFQLSENRNFLFFHKSIASEFTSFINKVASE